MSGRAALRNVRPTVRVPRRGVSPASVPGMAGGLKFTIAGPSTGLIS